VVSTGTVVIHPEHAARDRKPMYWWLFTSRRWTRPLPINVYVIERGDGLVLFDAGQDRASVTDAGYFPGGVAGVMYDRLARFDVGPADTLTAQLAALGYDIADVHTVVLSHLHQDHIGGLRELTAAEIVVSGQEWRALDGAARVSAVPHRPARAVLEARGFRRPPRRPAHALHDRSRPVR
jgi:glyoxylase-like metal-dependent hydrolase (beta-lactamase superfamily II)